MNPYHRLKSVSPDSQPFFTEADGDTSDIENDYEESQSLISAKKRYRNDIGSTDSSAVDYNDLSTKVLGANSGIDLNKGDLQDSQPLFSEVTKDTANDKTKKRKIDNMPNNEEPPSSMSKSSMNHRSSEAGPSAITVNYSDRNTKVLEASSKKFSNEQEAKIYTESDLYSKNGDKMPNVICIDCMCDKEELDKRNYYFGNLLIGELQFLPPCMRSEAYMNILRYVDSLKRKHRKRENN